MSYSIPVSRGNTASWIDVIKCYHGISHFVYAILTVSVSPIFSKRFMATPVNYVPRVTNIRVRYTHLWGESGAWQVAGHQRLMAAFIWGDMHMCMSNVSREHLGEWMIFMSIYLLRQNSSTSIGIKTWISSDVHVKKCDVIPIHS